MSTASKKRKLGEGGASGEKEQKFYAVRAGKTPGVYLTWKECQDNITGFKGANFKSFPSQQAAQDFVDGKVVASTSKDAGDKFYGVAVGKKPGVYTDWEVAKLQVQDVKGPKYKKFATRKEAEEFVKSGGKVPAASTTKKDKLMAEDAEEKVVKKQKVGETKKKTTVYTDGSSLGNGQKGSAAGVGVYFGDLDPRNVSEPLEGMPQTNNRAELTGILRALELAPKDRDLEIITDSNYSINCVTIWYDSWERKQWKTSAGKAVENQDLIKSIKALIRERDGLDLVTIFTWIKGHDNDPGNEAADRLAVAGAHLGRARQ
ncbi:related to ribonuclease H1 [Phialocephala subalpina]|uniref:Ribonuclease H n=1 Tax=Phialocephala subalpina TaxID=576137 RepID=A0A1L7WLZ6_9HELO|nr:related to ribonuclease H1 [Phialocephala subalpina]